MVCSPAAASRVTSSTKYDWIPPRRGGKSLVTSRTRDTLRRLAGHPLLQVGEHARHVGTQDVMHGDGQVSMADTTRGSVEGSQRRRPAGVGDETREPPRPVVGLRTLQPRRI